MDKLVKLYIVDDEMMAIDYFKVLVKKASPLYSVVGASLNGNIVLTEIMYLKPDIIFIDISMPIMNGLELSEKILKENKMQKIVLLTSYRDFNYIKKGMELGITSYMLKNELCKESLQKEIEKIIQQIHIERKKAHSYTELNLKEFLTLSSNNQEDFSYQNRPMQRYGLVYILRNKPIQWQHSILPQVRINSMELEDLPLKEGLTCRNAIQISEDSWCAIYFINEKISDSKAVLLEACEITKHYFNARDVEVTCILSHVTPKFLELPIIYKRIAKHVGDMFFYGKNQILTEDNIEYQDKKSLDYQPLITKLMEEIEDENYVEGYSILRQLLEECSKKYTGYEYIEMIKEVRSLFKHLEEKKKLNLDFKDTKEEFWSQEEILEYFEMWLEAFVASDRQQESEQYSRKVLGALEYIRGHYQQNISVQDIADAVNLSEGYLRKCFKNELNSTVVDFLTNYRIHRSKELMREGYDKITDICIKTGFTSSQYFSYVFKKVEGISPSEYIKNL